METTTPTVGQRVSVQLPNWDGPGCIIYTVESVDRARGTVTLNPPKLPGGSTAGPTVPVEQIVAR